MNKQNIPDPPPGGGFKFPESQPQGPKTIKTSEDVIVLLKEWSKVINNMRPQNEKKPKELQDEKLLIEKMSKSVNDYVFKVAILSSVLLLRDRLILEIGDWKQRLEEIKKPEVKENEVDNSANTDIK